MAAMNCMGHIVAHLDDGGPLINQLGEVVGVRFHNKGFAYTPVLTENVVLRWWNHYKKFGEFCRPWVGMDVCNLHEAELDVLLKLPNVGTGVIVTKV